MGQSQKNTFSKTIQIGLKIISVPHTFGGKMMEIEQGSSKSPSNEIMDLGDNGGMIHIIFFGTKLSI